MIKRILFCVVCSLATGLTFLSDSAPASWMNVDSNGTTNVRQVTARLAVDADKTDVVERANLVPIQFYANREGTPGIIRPILEPFFGLSSPDNSSASPQPPLGITRIRPRQNANAPAPSNAPATPNTPAPSNAPATSNAPNTSEAPVASDAPTAPNPPAEPVAAEQPQPVAEEVVADVDPPEIPALPADEAAHAADDDNPDPGVAPDTSNVPVPGTEAPETNDDLDLGNEHADAPDAAVQIPEGTVSEADRQAAQEQPTTEEPVAVQTTDEIRQQTKSWRYPNAEKAVIDMSNDLLANLKNAGGNELYERWRSYNASIRRRTNSLQTGNELNSRCRLRWYERLYQDPLRSVIEAEKSSNLLGQCFMGSSDDVVAGVRYARFLTDVPVRQNRIERRPATNANEALDMLKAALVEAASHHAKALSPMNKNDLAAVSKEAHKIFCEQVRSGHTVEMRGRAMYLIDAMEKMNKSEMYDAGESIMSLLDPQTLAALRQLDFASLEKVRIGDNQEVGLIHSEAGDILVGDTNRTVWELDRYPNACCVVDLGGDDVYREGSCILNRPLLVIIDLGKGGDDYVGKNVAIQGGSILGVSVWYDDGGNDSYLAKDVCQGSTIGGFAALINDEGDDRYLGFLREQGVAICGFGVLIDRAGNDDYRGALFAQGVGGPGGFGAIVDRDGRDHYYVGGYYFDSYPEHPGYDGWGQGVGAGIRRVACGGIGVLLDGGGDDAYEYDYFGHGGGYWMGVGIARDFGGNDIRYAATSTMYDGSQRRERRWQRFGAGFGCHYAIGYLFDDEGNDVYGGTIMGVGMGWDLGAGFLVDFQGNDTFEANGGLTQGCGAEGSIGVIMNYRGDDAYNSSYVGYSNNQLTYHAPSNCGSNFSFVIDHGGQDAYGGSDSYRQSIRNNMVTRRGTITGMIVDRPAPEEDKNVAVATSGKRDAITLASGYGVKPSSIKTMAAPPPLYDTTPHATSSGPNAFNPSANDGFGGEGGGLFRGGLFGGRMF